MTLTEPEAAVKKRRKYCCAITKRLPATLWIRAAQPVPWSGAQWCQSGSLKCARQNHKPHCVQRRCAGLSHATSRWDTPLQVRFLGALTCLLISTSICKRPMQEKPAVCGKLCPDDYICFSLSARFQRTTSSAEGNRKPDRSRSLLHRGVPAESRRPRGP